MCSSRRVCSSSWCMCACASRAQLWKGRLERRCVGRRCLSVMVCCSTWSTSLYINDAATRATAAVPPMPHVHTHLAEGPLANQIQHHIVLQPCGLHGLSTDFNLDYVNHSCRLGIPRRVSHTQQQQLRSGESSPCCLESLPCRGCNAGQCELKCSAVCDP